MTLETRIVALAQAIGTDIKGLRAAIGIVGNITGEPQDIVVALNALINNVQTNSNAIGTIGNLAVYGAENIVQALNTLNDSVGANSTAIGNLTALDTTAKTSIVDAINEVVSGLGGVDLTAIINDAALAGTLDKTYSVDKILALLTALKGDILGSAPEALDTLKELGDALGANPNLATDIATALALRVRVDTLQGFDAAQQAQGRTNIGAASAADLSLVSGVADGLVLAIGNPDYDFAAAYAAAAL